MQSNPVTAAVDDDSTRQSPYSSAPHVVVTLEEGLL